MKTAFGVSAFAEPSADRQRSAFRVQALLITVLLITDHSLHAQGPLTPPGPPALTFKTLTDVEPRAVVNATNTPGDGLNLCIISQPGSYYLATNIVGVASKNGIAIRANAVTLDLNGFALLGVAGANAGIAVQGSYTNLCIRNGTISDWANGDGVLAQTAFNSQFGRLRISRNGTANGSQGLWTGADCSVIGCAVMSNGEIGFGGDGIHAGERSFIKDCTATDNAGIGIFTSAGATVTDCSVAANRDQGIQIGDGSRVQNCSVSGNLNAGIVTTTRGTIHNCTVTGNQSTGIAVGQTALVGDCLVESNGVHGIAAGADSLIQRCAARGNASNGISVGDGSTVLKCSASANTNGVVATTACTVRQCTVSTNKLDGIRVGANCQVWNNVAMGNGNGTTSTAGIHATGNGNRIDGNHASINNGDGILVDATAVKNFVARNTGGGQTCGGCFQIRVPGIPGQPPAGANVVGPVVTDATNVNANAWANLFQF